MAKIARFFIAKGKQTPLHKELARITKARRAAFKVLKVFMDKHGLEAMHGATPNDYLFDPKDVYTYDKQKWSVMKRPRGAWYLRPRRNTTEGKALAEEVKALPECPRLSYAIHAVPGLGSTPVVFTESRAFHPFIRYFNHKSGLVIVEVPSWEGKAKIADREEAQKWKPPAWLREVKEWEALKAIDKDGS